MCEALHRGQTGQALSSYHLLDKDGDGMITQEVMQATMRERMVDFAHVRVEHEALRSREKAATASSQQSQPSWFRMPSFVTHALRPASAH